MLHNALKGEVRSPSPTVYQVIKVLVLGACSVGKTSLIRRLIGEDFNENQKSTLYDVYEKQFESEHGDFIFQFTDSGGSRSFPPVRQLEISKSDICLLVYNVNDKKTVENAKYLKDEIEITAKNVGYEIPFILVGNKVDLLEPETEENTEQMTISASSMLALQSTVFPFILVGDQQDSQQRKGKESSAHNHFDSCDKSLEDTCASHILTSAKSGINVFNLLKTLSSESEAINLGTYGSRLRKQLSGDHTVKM